jgi:branched-chain amino acid transport system ATP-binding protein
MLKASHIDVCYGATQVLRDVSFHIARRSITTLLGGNGAGKTTTLKALSGILKVRGGTIEFLDERIDGFPSSRIVKLGLCHIPQERELFTQMTVLENLELGACTRNDGPAVRADIDRMYDYFPILKQYRDKSAGFLSGGEQQMLTIARGLMARPKLLTLDEPSSGLAPIIIGKISRIIRRLCEDGITILLVEQNVRMALQLSVSSYILRSGQIVFEGPTKELKDEAIFRKYID